MTQFLYNLELQLQTSGDGSTFTILGPEGSREQLGEIIDKLKQWKFAVDDSARGDFVHFRAIPLQEVRDERKGETLRENILTGIAVQLKVELDLALEIIDSLKREMEESRLQRLVEWESD